MDVGERLRRHVEARLNDGVAKYFDHALDSHVVFEPEGPLVRADISVHVGRGIQVQGHGAAEDAQNAFDLAMERIAKRLRRNKRRLRDHHRKSGSARREEALTAQHVILADPGDRADEESERRRSAGHRGDGRGKSSSLSRLTVGEAVIASRSRAAAGRRLPQRRARRGERDLPPRRRESRLARPVGRGRDRGSRSAKRLEWEIGGLAVQRRGGRPAARREQETGDPGKSPGGRRR